MRSNSPYSVRHSPYARSWSFSHYYPGASSPNPVNSLPFTDATSSFPGRGPSPYPRRVSRGATDGGLDSVIERTQESGYEEEEEKEDDERQALLEDEDGATAVYGRRWYLLLLFSFLALVQTMSWAMWGPISESAEAVFSWEDSDVTMCVFLGNLTFGAFCIPFSWLMDHRGLRVSMVLSCLCVMAGAGVRCLLHFVPASYYTWCVYAGQLLNGIAGPVAQGGGALFSNLWFPNNQRATSTAISTFIGYGGSALAFVVGPLLIPSPSDDPTNNNDTMPTGNDTAAMQNMLTNLGNSSGPDDNNTLMFNAVLSYLDYQAIAAVVLFVLAVVYFPDKPPSPPSLSAATEREDFGPGLAKLLKNKQFWLISAAFCLSLGVFEVWDVVLDVNLSTIGISQETAGWLGFYCVMAGCVTGLLICRLADIFFRQIRLFLILAYIVSALFVLWFILIYVNILPFDITSIYAAIILSGVFLDGCCPLVYELICEAAYPVGEGVSSCFLQMLFVLVGMAFAAVQNVPNIGTEWMNWCLFGCLCAAIPLLFLVTDVYGRADLDTIGDQVIVVNPPVNSSTQHDHTEKTPLTLTLPRPTPTPPHHHHHLTTNTTNTTTTRTRSQSDYGTYRSSTPSLLLYGTFTPTNPETTTTHQVPTASHSQPCKREDNSLSRVVQSMRGGENTTTTTTRCLSQPNFSGRRASAGPAVGAGGAGESRENGSNRSSALRRFAFSATSLHNATFQGLDEELSDSDPREVLSPSRRRDWTGERGGGGGGDGDGFGEDHQQGVFDLDQSFTDPHHLVPGAERGGSSSHLVPVDGRVGADNSSSPVGRSLLTSDQHSVDLSFLRV